MKKIEFQDYPSTETPLNAENLNQMQDNIEEAIEEHYSTEEQVIGTWVDGKPVYKKSVVGNNVANGTLLVSNVDTLISATGSAIVSGVKRNIGYFEMYNNNRYSFNVGFANSNNVVTETYVGGNGATCPKLNVVLIYTKTTD